MSALSASVVDACKEKLLLYKQEILNSLSNTPPEYLSESSGDSADQTARYQKENEWIAMQSRMRGRLFEIEAALSRIDKGTYGICEETGYLIEPRRLMSIPWTRLSLEGAMTKELNL